MTEPKFDVVAIGNAIVDVIARADDAFITSEGIAKGSMRLVDSDTAEGLYSRMGPGIEASGGSAVFPESLEEVESVALAMAHEIRNQYIIAYTPSNQALDGSFRTIKVTANGPGRPSVRTRSGYYATPEANRTTSARAK